MGNIELVIKIDEELYQTIKETDRFISEIRGGSKRLDYILFNAVYTGTPLSELKDKWKSSCEQMLQEKMCELNTRKNELENQLNISVQNNIMKEMIMCCSEGK